MTTAVALSFATFVVKKLGELLLKEALTLRGVKPQVEQLQAQLNRMEWFLAAADARPKGGADESIIQNCVAEIREACYDAEAAIATFVVQIAFRTSGRSGQFPFVLKRYLCIFKECLALREVRLEIKAINTRITNSLTTGFQTCGILNSTGVGASSSSTSMTERQRQLRQSYTHIPEVDVVGTEEDVKAIVDLLVKENARYRVVSIWGMGGLGKTTLAKTVYKHIEISRHFKCVAWAYISQQCNTRDTREVLEGILLKLLFPSNPSKEEREEIEKLKHDELVKKLYQVQSEKKCLVILDDIWKDEDWNSLSPGFPNTTEVGSKILLTTRNKNVAKHVDQQCVPYELRHLSEKESWELFEKKIFLRRNKEFEPSTEMMKLGKEMVKHCGGLPLAIVVLGGLIANKQEMEEWKMVSRNINYYLNKKGEGIHERVQDILALSYQDLPYHLKACFLCLSHLPKDYEIRAEKLVQLWMAEGIVSSSSEVGEMKVEETMMDVGMSYLSELAQRCMVQVQLTRFSRRIKLCRLHDLMRELCLSKAQEENFLKVVCVEAFDNQQLKWENSASSSSSSPLTKIRRLAVYYLGYHDANNIRQEYINLEELTNRHHLRSCQFYFFGEGLKISVWEQIKSFLKGFKVLRILDVESMKFHVENEMLPRDIGNLFHLRYLNIKDSEIKSVPSSIGNLRFLQTLDLRAAYSVKIPDVLWRLEQLRHLYLPTEINGRSKLRLDGLSKLETLEAFHTEYCDVRYFPKLTNLRKVDVHSTYPKDLAVILKSPILNNSNSLLLPSLFYSICGYFETEEDQSLLSQLLGCHQLRKLTLMSLDRAIKLPDQFPPNLTKLSLQNTKLEEDPMLTLEKFPNLRTLYLKEKSYMGKEMVCSSGSSSISGGGGGGGYGSCDGGGFPKLISLKLFFLENLEEWRVEKGAMPCLSHLEIISCKKLKEIPDGLRFITTLRELCIINASEALQQRVREEGKHFFNHIIIRIDD